MFHDHDTNFSSGGHGLLPLQIKLLNNLHDLGVDLSASGVWDRNTSGFGGFLADTLGIVLFAEAKKGLPGWFGAEEVEDIFEIRHVARFKNS